MQYYFYWILRTTVSCFSDNSTFISLISEIQHCQIIVTQGKYLMCGAFYFCSLEHSMYQISKSCFLAWVVYIRLISEAWCLVFFSISYFLKMKGQLARCNNPNLEDQVIFGQGFLPLVLDKSISNCQAAMLVLVHPAYFIFPLPTISGERCPIRHLARRPMGVWMEGV